MFKSCRAPSRRDRPQHSVVIMGFKCNKLFRYFFSLFTIFHLWLTIIRCQEPINGSQRCLCEAFFFLKKMKAVFKGGIYLLKFSWRTKLPHPHPESQSTSRSSLFAIPIQYGGIGRRGDRCRRYFRLSASIKFKRSGWRRSQR